MTRIQATWQNELRDFLTQMKFVLTTALLLACCSAGIKAQTCLTDDDVKQMLSRVDASPAPTPNKKLREELIKMADKQRELLLKVVDKDQKKQSDQEKLSKTYDDNIAKFCQLIKTQGWPTSAVVDQDGVLAAFHILKNAGTYEIQRDLLPVIVAAIKKDSLQKREFAGLYDRLRVSAGMKQLFGTQAVSMGGFLVIYPIEDEGRLDARRAEYGLPSMDHYMNALEGSYRKPVIKARQPPGSHLSKQLTDSLTKAIGETQLGPSEVDPNDVIKTETNLVSLNVSVFSSKLKMFAGSLAKEDFRVQENGQDQTVTYFASTAVPFDLVLVVDLSGSTKEKRNLIKQSTLRFIEAARPADRLAIVTFSGTTNLISPLTLDRAQLAASVLNMEGGGESHVWDAVKFALDDVLGPKTPERRRAVVLMSDGVDGLLVRIGKIAGSKTSFADLLEQVRQTDALIVPIYLDTEKDWGYSGSDSYENARRALNLLADESGGSYYRAGKISDLNGVYEQVINDLGKVYSLGYKPTNTTHDSTWRQVNVSIVNRTDLVARTRPGYYAQ